MLGQFPDRLVQTNNLFVKPLRVRSVFSPEDDEQGFAGLAGQGSRCLVIR
jgi:hypothetical protein